VALVMNDWENEVNANCIRGSWGSAILTQMLAPEKILWTIQVDTLEI
jgi:hypothetical protein